MALIDLNKIIKTGTSAFDVIKSGGTTKAALEAANRTYQSKPGDSSSSSSKSSSSSSSILNNPLKAVSTPTIDIINGVTAANKAAQTPTPITPSQALAQGKGPIASTVAQPIIQQPVQQVPQVDPNLATQIQDLIKALQQNNQPKAIPQYQSQYSDDIAQAINQFNSRPDFKFDATNNPTIEANKKLIGDSVTQEMGRRNILNSTITGDRMTEDIATMVNTVLPQLQQQAFNQDQAERAMDLQKIQTLQNRDQNAYDMFLNSYNMGNASNQTLFNNNMNIASLIDALDTKNYNKEQNAAQFDYTKSQDAINNAQQDSQLTGQYNPYAQYTLTPDILSQISQFSNDYQAGINRIKATPDTTDDALIPYIENARYQKITSDPTLNDKYGDQYKTPSQRAAEYSNAIEQQKLELEKDPNSLDNQLKLFNLAKAQEELSQLATYGQQQQAKLDEIQSQVAQNKASASASYASANASNALATQRKNNPNGTSSTSTDGLNYKDYYEAGVEMKNAGTYDDYKNYVPRYNDQQIFTWVDGLPIPVEQKAQLAKDIGLSEKVKTTEKVQGPYNWN